MRLIAAALLLSGALLAAPIDISGSLFNTGESTTGSADNYWTIVAPPGAAQVIALSSIPGSWLANTSGSQWVWKQTDGQPIGTGPAPLTYTFRYTFLLDPLLSASTVAITGRWATDNLGLDIQVNGSSTGQINVDPGFASWTSFSLGSGFVAGLNIVDFIVQDYGVIGGFRAEWLTASADNGLSPVPEPHAWLMMATGLALVLRCRVGRV